MKRNKQTGETIVEVLISMAILGSVLGTAYAISSRALIRAQNAQERVQALKQVEGQIERLKYIAVHKTSAYTSLIDALSAGGSGPQCLATVVDDVVLKPKNDAACIDASGRTRFYFSEYEESRKQFTARAEWDEIGSSVQDVAEIKYRIQIAE